MFYSHAAPGISPGISWCGLSTSSPHFSILNCTITAGWKKQIFYVVSEGGDGILAPLKRDRELQGSELGFPPWFQQDVPSTGARRVTVTDNTEKILVGHGAQLLLAPRQLQKTLPGQILFSFTSAAVPTGSA